MAGDRKLRLVANIPGIPDQVPVSPDGRWIAFNSDETGRWEVYVASFPEFSSKQQISPDGGVQPLWRRDSRELFYLSPQGKLMAVEMVARGSATLEARPPRVLFQTGLNPSPQFGEYAVTPDGERFLVAGPRGRQEPGDHSASELASAGPLERRLENTTALPLSARVFRERERRARIDYGTRSIGRRLDVPVRRSKTSWRAVMCGRGHRLHRRS
jgi:hypothetical protein